MTEQATGRRANRKSWHKNGVEDESSDERDRDRHGESVTAMGCAAYVNQAMSGNVISLGEAQAVVWMTTLVRRHPETRFVPDGET